ncbi:pre-mRNA-processing factor 39 [Aphelenchoides avenae]|nr:pre-mRNA-processing factor 39 [Aphelenchus avenae]
MGRNRSDSDSSGSPPPERHHRRNGSGRSRSRERSRRDSSSDSPNVLKEAWRVVKKDPEDFDAWTRLITLSETQDDERAIREVYEAFLRRYPYCYGYWRKFAEMERRHHHYDKCLDVYQRGVDAIPMSVDLWMSYIEYIKVISQGQRQAKEKIRDVYMQAIDACGLDFRSDRLWDDYVQWEVSVGEVDKASFLFDVILMTPTAGYAAQFEKYKAFINSQEPDRILSQQEYDEITDVVYARIKDRLDGPMFFIEEYEAEPAVAGDYEEVTKKVIRQRKHIDVALKEYRDEIIQRRHKRYMDNEREVSKRWLFESAVKRPYFHVKPLERDQLKNWHDYLDFEIKEKKRKRIFALFERCMIACAQYEEMWIKYAAYLDSLGDAAQAKNVYKRAMETHCPRKPGLALAFSAYQEKHEGTDAALAVLTDFERRTHTYSAITLRKLNLERRMLQNEKSADFSAVISKYERLIHDASVPRKVSSFYALKLARFHAKVRHDKKLAEKVLRDAINNDKGNLQLYLALVDMALSSSHFRESEVVEALDAGIRSKDLAMEDRFMFSQRKLDFLEELGTDPGKLHDHIAYHLKLEKRMEAPTPTLFNGKRLAPLKDEPAEKRPKVDGPAAAAPIGMPNLSAPPPMIPQVVAGPFQSGQQALGYNPAMFAAGGGMPQAMMTNGGIPVAPQVSSTNFYQPSQNVISEMRTAIKKE